MGKRIRTPLLVWILVMVLVTTGACRTVMGGPGRPGDEPTRQLRPTMPRNTAIAPPPIDEPQETAQPEATDQPDDPDATQPAPPQISIPAGADILAACQSDQQQATLRSAAPQISDLPMDTCYNLTIQLNEDGTQYTGTARIDWVNTTGTDLTEIILRIYPNSSAIYGGQLVVESAVVDGQAIDGEVFLPDDTALRLPLSEPIAADQQTVIELTFTGQIPSDFRQGGYGIFQRTTQAGAPIVSLANWYPMLAEWEDDAWQAEEITPEGDAVVSPTALYHVIAQVEPGWQVAGTGLRQDGADGTVEFFSGPTRDMILLASPAFTVQEGQYEDVTLRHWAVDLEEDVVGDALQVTADSFSVYEERFGPYPYTEMDIVALPLEYAAGVEYPGLILIEQSLYDDAGESSFLWTVLAHEAAHQWWYSVVGNDVLEEPWQDEGLTTFSEMLYQEQFNPGEYMLTLAFYRATVRSLSGNPPIGRPVAEYADQGDDYSTVVYLKGAMFFAELREEIGDEAFFAGLQQYYAEQQFRIAPVTALLDAFESSSGRELDDFYAEWGAE